MNFLDENGLGHLWAQIILKLNSKVPDGGTTGQVLKKTETGTEWADGEKGITPTIGSNGNWYLGSTDTGKPSRGASGVGIQKVEQTTISNEDGGTNVITVTKTDGSSSTFSVKNGNKGSDGYTPVKGTDYFTEADKNELVNLVLANFTNVSEVGM